MAGVNGRDGQIWTWAERESAGEILTLSLSKGPIGAESKDLTPAHLASFYFVRLRYATAQRPWGARGRLGKKADCWRLIANGWG